MGFDIKNRTKYVQVTRLVRVSGGVTARFAYEGDDRRVQSTINTNLKTAFIGNYYEYEVLNGTTITQRFYYYAGGTRVAMRTGLAGALIISSPTTLAARPSPRTATGRTQRSCVTTSGAG